MALNKDHLESCEAWAKLKSTRQPYPIYVARDDWTSEYFVTDEDYGYNPEGGFYNVSTFVGGELQ